MERIGTYYELFMRLVVEEAQTMEGEDRLDKSRQTSEEEAQAVVLRMVEAEQESPVSRLKCPPPPASDQESVIRSNGRINETADVGRVSVPEAVNGARNNEDVSINLVNAQERGQPTGVITANHGRKLVLEKFVHEEDSDSDSGLHIHLSEEHSEDTSDAETRSPYSVKGNEAHQANDSFPVKDSTKDAKSKDSPLDCSKAQEEGELHCSVCKKRFSTDGALHKHFSDEHLSIRMNSSIFEPESPAPVRLRRDIFEEEEPERETATPFVQPSEQQMNSGNTGTSMPPRPMPVYNQTATNLAYQEQSRQNSTLGGGKAGMIIVEPPQPMFSLSTFDLSNTHQQALGHSGLAKTNSAPPPLQPAGSLVRALGNNVPPNSNRVYREEYRYQQQFRLPFTPPEQNHTSGSAYKSSAPFKPPGVTGNTDPDVPRIVQVTSMQQSDAKRSVPPGQLHTEMRENNYPPNYFNSRSLAQPDYEHQSHIYLKNALANKRSSRDDSIEASKRAKVDVALSQHPGNSIDKLPTYQQASNFDQRAMSVLPRAIAYPPNTPSTLSPTLPRQGSSPNGTACAVNTTQSNNMRLGNAATLSSCPTTGSAEQYQYHQNSMMTSAARGNPAAFNQSRMSQTHQQFDMEAYARMYEASKNQVTAAAAANARAAGGHQFAVPKHPAPRTVTNTSDRTPTIDLTHEEFLRNVQNNIQNNRVNGQQQYPQMPQHPQRIQQRPAANQTVPSKNLERQTTYSCPICRASFISIQMYEEHLRVFHGHLQPQNSSQQPRLSPPVRNRDSDIELSRHNGSRAPPQNISPQPQQSAGPQNPVRNVAPKSLCIPILDFNKVDAQKLRKLEELGITGVIPLAGYDKSVGSLGIPIMPLRPERTIGAQLPWESVLPLGPAHLPSLLTNGMAAFRDYEHQTQSSRMQSPR